ncbi:hypothetical protein RSAG8_05897, partial [Rhizoctonia solani AG-8 WAC10335]
MVNVVFSFEARDVVRRCLTNYCTMVEIASYLDGHDIIQLSRTSKWLCFTIWGSPLIWKKALSRVGVDVDLPVTPFRTLYTYSILSFTTDCMLCGSPTKNGILGEGEASTRFCNECAFNVLIPAPGADQPPLLMKVYSPPAVTIPLIYTITGPHRYFKMALRHGVSRVRIPALLSHAVRLWAFGF